MPEAKGFGDYLAEGKRRGHSTPSPIEYRPSMSSYNTFDEDPNVKKMLHTSLQIEESIKSMSETEFIAKNALVELELQRAQLQDMRGMVTETSTLTSQTRALLNAIAERTYRRKVFLWMVIVILIIADLLIFYLVYVR
uniref:AlNc14C108G6310 protein n=1 Tax=Albugo laibachii Nc14 TaxID=890382 RepID=F0WIA6_9STRA|nr:AlNc14C108G6310 [Albugo laibachii Nc14]|eukprot:CCA20985.1 AlNc14C108G6310 [Albugo laibachii Nc14]